MSDLDQPGPSGEADNAAVEVEAGNIIPNDPQTHCSFIKELQEKGYIFAKDMHAADGSLQNRMYYMSLEEDPVIPESLLQQKASSNAETIKLQIEPSRVGSGGFGSCYRCVQRQAQEGSSSIKANDICLKLGLFFDDRERPDKEANRHLLRELKNFRRLESKPHDNIIRFLFACTTERNQVCIGLEYFRGRDLSKMINGYSRRGKRFKTDHINIILNGVVSAVMHLQKLDIIHCDIKPHNVLFSSYSLKVKLIDFGCAFVWKEKKTDFGGTSIYMAPEMLGKTKTPYLDSTDVYSIGALGYRLVTFKRPWHDNPEVESAMRERSRHKVSQAIEKAMQELKQVELEDGSTVSMTSVQVNLRDAQADHKKIYPAHCHIICQMLHLNPSLRPTCEGILQYVKEECSNTNQRQENRFLAQSAADLAASTQQELTDTSEMPVPAIPELDASNSSSAVTGPTGLPHSIFSGDRRLYVDPRGEPQASTGGSHHTTTGSGSSYMVVDGHEVARADHLNTPQQNIHHNDCNQDQQDARVEQIEFEPYADDNLPLDTGLLPVGRNPTDEQRPFIAPSLPIMILEENSGMEWSDVEDFEAFERYGGMSSGLSTSIQFLPGADYASMSFQETAPSGLFNSH